MRQQRQTHTGTRASGRRGLKATVLLALVLVGVLSLLGAASPQAARASIFGDAFNFGKGVFNTVTNPGGAVASAASGIAETILPTILNQLFGGLQASFTMSVFDGLLETSNPAANSNVGELGGTMQAISFGLLSAVLTVTVLRYYFAGLGGSLSGFEPYQAFMRVIGACAAVIVWPWAFDWAIDLQNALIDAFWNSQSLHDDLQRMFATLDFVFVAGAGFAWFLSVLLAIGAIVLILGLVVLKIILTASIVLLFVAMPLCLILWPIPEMAWLAGAAMRMFITLLLIPVAWGLLFAAAAAVGMDSLTFKGSGTVPDALMKPLIALSLMWLTFVVPKHMMRMAMMGMPMLGGGRGSGFISGMSRYMVARRLDSAIAPHIPQWAGGVAHQAPRFEPTQQAKSSATASPTASSANALPDGGGRGTSTSSTPVDGARGNPWATKKPSEANGPEANSGPTGTQNGNGMDPAAAGTPAATPSQAQRSQTPTPEKAAAARAVAAGGAQGLGASVALNGRALKHDRSDGEGLPQKPPWHRSGAEAAETVARVATGEPPAYGARDAMAALTPKMRNQVGHMANTALSSGNATRFTSDLSRTATSPLLSVSEAAALTSLAGTPPAQVAEMADRLRAEGAPVQHLEMRSDPAPTGDTSSAGGRPASSPTGANGPGGTGSTGNGHGHVPPTPRMHPRSHDAPETAPEQPLQPRPQRPPTDLN